MKFKQMLTTFLIPLILFLLFGFAHSRGWISGVFFIPYAIVVVIIMISLKRKKNVRAHQNCQSIPEGKFVARLEAFSPLTEELRALGFDLADQFYFESSPVVVISAYIHRENGDLCMAYNFGAVISYETTTEFENGFSFTTCGRVDSGISPRAPKKMLCIEPTNSVSELYARHHTERTYLISQHLAPRLVASDQIRTYFATTMKEYYDHTAGIPFFSIRMFFWTFNQRGKVHLNSLEKQIQQGTIKGLTTGKGF